MVRWMPHYPFFWEDTFASVVRDSSLNGLTPEICQGRRLKKSFLAHIDQPLNEF